MGEELEPCPLCGGSNIFVVPDEIGSGGRWIEPIHVGCDMHTGCGAKIVCETEEEAGSAAD